MYEDGRPHAVCWWMVNYLLDARKAVESRRKVVAVVLETASDGGNGNQREGICREFETLFLVFIRTNHVVAVAVIAVAVVLSAINNGASYVFVIISSKVSRFFKHALMLVVIERMYKGFLVLLGRSAVSFDASSRSSPYSFSEKVLFSSHTYITRGIEKKMPGNRAGLANIHRRTLFPKLKFK